MKTSLTRKRMVAVLEVCRKTVLDQLDGVAGKDFKWVLADNLEEQKISQRFGEGPAFDDLVAECTKFLVEGDIALKLFDLYIAERPMNLSNEYRRELIAAAKKIGVNPQDLLDMVSERAELRKAEVFKPYDPQESTPESRQGGRKRKQRP